MSETVSQAVEQAAAVPKMIALDVSSFLAQLGRLDNRPETISAMERGLNVAWEALDRVAEVRDYR